MPKDRKEYHLKHSPIFPKSENTLFYCCIASSIDSSIIAEGSVVVVIFKIVLFIDIFVEPNIKKSQVDVLEKIELFTDFPRLKKSSKGGELEDEIPKFVERFKSLLMQKRSMFYIDQAAHTI
jgi:hypothetical protein